MREIFCGFCDVCRVMQQFGSKLERDWWELHHEHTEPGT